jgi:hypothetical protein
MMLSAGTDTYGRVKSVSGTPIVTKFAMLQFLPVYPLKSFYYMGAGTVEIKGIPLFARISTSEIKGIPLASVDRTSVLIAYIRSIFAAMALIGCVALVPLYSILLGEHLDGFAMMATRFLLIALIAGIVGGALTYVIPLTPRREKDIRRFCAEKLGISADPARVSPEMSAMFLAYINNQPQASKNSREQLIRELIRSRAQLARAKDADHSEALTDRLLDELNHAERVKA